MSVLKTGTLKRFLLASAALLASGTLASFGARAADLPLPQPAAFQDPLFTQPYIDVDEWRDTPVRHRYVHGGFKGTDARFSMYFPPKEQYQGRFFQHLMAVSGNEFGAQRGTGESSDLAFSIASGGYALESNLGKLDMYPNPTDHGVNSILGYRASAAVAKYSREVAAKMYGPHRTYGYVWGGSGGSYKTISCVESTAGLWDGSVPYIVPSPVAAPNIYGSVGHATRILKDKLNMVADAVEPGGSGDIYAGLNENEKAALRQLMLMGFPPRSLYKWDRLGMGALPNIVDNFKVWDPTYWDDFWKVKGYLGHDNPDALKADRIQVATKITKVIMADEARKLGLPTPMAAGSAGEAGMVPAGFIVENLPKGDLRGTSFIARGNIELFITAVIGDVVTVAYGPINGPHVNEIKAGDPVRFDNSTWLAFQTYPRHQVPPKEQGFYIFDQFRGPDGKPMYPQRAVLTGPKMNEIGGGSLESGKFAGKMIMVESLMDEHAAPWNADWYNTKVKEALGANTDNNYRLWFTDHALHGGPVTASDQTHVISFAGILQQALRDVAAWAEKGTAPPANTSYKMVDDQVIVPATAADRKGIQPVVALKANGGARAEVAVGKPVTFTADIDVPPSTGSVVSAEWDFEDTGKYPVTEELKDTKSPHVTLTKTYTFTKPGTYFAVIRVASQRQGDAKSPFAWARNLDRARVVVK